MGVQLNVSLETEILAPEEIGEISGRARKDDQMAWLRLNGWKFSINATGQPIVGRLYARMKLAGIELSDAFTPQLAQPDFSKVR